MKTKYFVDIRLGCGAIRNRLHPDYDLDYQGLHDTTADVVEYIQGSYKNGEWNMKQEHIDWLHDKCKTLNEMDAKNKCTIDEVLNNSIKAVYYGESYANLESYHIQNICEILNVESISDEEIAELYVKRNLSEIDI